MRHSSDVLSGRLATNDEQNAYAMLLLLLLKDYSRGLVTSDERERERYRCLALIHVGAVQGAGTA